MFAAPMSVGYIGGGTSTPSGLNPGTPTARFAAPTTPMGVRQQLQPMQPRPNYSIPATPNAAPSTPTNLGGGSASRVSAVPVTPGAGAVPGSVPQGGMRTPMNFGGSRTPSGSLQPMSPARGAFVPATPKGAMPQSPAGSGVMPQTPMGLRPFQPSTPRPGGAQPSTPSGLQPLLNPNSPAGLQPPTPRWRAAQHAFGLAAPAEPQLACRPPAPHAAAERGATEHPEGAQALQRLRSRSYLRARSHDIALLR